MERVHKWVLSEGVTSWSVLHKFGTILRDLTESGPVKDNFVCVCVVSVEMGKGMLVVRRVQTLNVPQPYILFKR